MAISTAYLNQTTLPQSGGSKTINVTIGGSGSNNSIIVFFAGTYGVGYNATCTIGGVAATKVVTKVANNYASTCVFERKGLAPGTYAVYMAPNEWHSWQAQIFAVYDTLGAQASTAYTYQNVSSGQTIWATPSLTEGSLYMEFMRLCTTGSTARATPQSGQSLLHMYHYQGDGSYETQHLMFQKYGVGTSPSLGMYYYGLQNSNNTYIGLEFLAAPSGGGGGCVIWW